MLCAYWNKRYLVRFFKFQFVDLLDEGQEIPLQFKRGDGNSDGLHLFSINIRLVDGAMSHLS